MSTSHRIEQLVAIAAIGLCTLTTGRQARGQDQPAQSAQPDNSAQNKEQGRTADRQGNSQADVQTTAKIRRANVADKSLSTYAHNIKIITQNGHVTLKGGGTLLSVHCDTSDEISRAKKVLSDSGARDIASSGEKGSGSHDEAYRGSRSVEATRALDYDTTRTRIDADTVDDRDAVLSGENSPLTDRTGSRREYPPRG